MATLIDILTATVIGGAIILMIIGLNSYIDSTSRETYNSNMAQSNLTDFSSTVESDLYKIGYRISGDKMVIADSNQIKFFADLDNNGIADTLHFYLGSTSELTNTSNPNDKLLYRVQNNQTPKSSSAGVVDFKLTYYDSLGATLSYASLNSQTIRNRIKCINVYLKIEALYAIDGVYAGAEWKKIIRPKNLN